MRLPRELWQEQVEHRATLAEIEAIERHRRAREREWWWVKHRRRMLVGGLVALTMASVAFGILVRVM